MTTRIRTLLTCSVAAAFVLLAAGCGPMMEAGMGVSSVAPNSSALGEALQTDAFARVGLGSLQVEATVGARRHAYDDGAGRSGELSLAPYTLGARFVMLFGPVRPFVGAGVVGYLGSTSSITDVRSVDAQGAYRVTAGVDAWLPKSMRLGAEMSYELDLDDLRLSYAEGGGTRVGADAVSLRLSLAYRF